MGISLSLQPVVVLRETRSGNSTCFRITPMMETRYRIFCHERTAIISLPNAGSIEAILPVDGAVGSERVAPNARKPPGPGNKSVTSSEHGSCAHKAHGREVEPTKRVAVEYRPAMLGCLHYHLRTSRPQTPARSRRRAQRSGRRSRPRRYRGSFRGGSIRKRQAA